MRSNALLFSLMAVTIIVMTQPAAAQDGGGFETGIEKDLELLRNYTGRDLSDPKQIDRRIVIENEGSYFILDTRENGAFSWAIFENKGEKGVEFSVGAAPVPKEQQIRVQPLAIPVPRSSCGGAGETILAEPPYIYPLYLAYCRVSGSNNPKRGKSVVSTLPGNNDSAYVVATWELLCDNPDDAYELWVRGIWYQVCVQ